MAKNSPTGVEKCDAVAIRNDLHAIAARLAGVEEILLEMVESPEGRGNSLHLLASVIAGENKQICYAADRMGALHKTEVTI